MLKNEKLVIKNFGPIKNIELDLKQMLVLIGPQSVGKSVIAKLITIFREYSFVVLSKSFEEFLGKYGISSFLMDESYIKYECDSYLFTYENKKPTLIPQKNHEIKPLVEKVMSLFNGEGKMSAHELAESTKQKVSTLISLLNKLEKAKNNSKNLKNLKEQINKLSGEIEQYDKEIEERISFGNQLTDKIQKYANYSIYIPAERQLIPIISGASLSLSSNNVPLPDIILQFGSEFEKARQKVKLLKIDFLNSKYKYSKNEDYLVFKGKNIMLREASSGFQSLVPMLLVIENNYDLSRGGHTFVIEEPELNLYPNSQFDLIKNIVPKCLFKNEEYYNELIVTTHSPYILAAINNLLLAFKTGTISSYETEKIVGKSLWINPDNFNAYFITSKGAQNIFNRKTGLIEEEELDKASNNIINEFDQLADIISSNL